MKYAELSEKAKRKAVEWMQESSAELKRCVVK